MNYEEMSDFEVNKAVACIIYPQLKLLTHNDGRSVFVSKSEDKLDFMAIKNSRFNPCNNPSDTWLIILDNGISINKWDKSDSFWTADVEHPKACDEYNTIEVKHENPLRAAMICFLKMKDAENGI